MFRVCCPMLLRVVRCVLFVVRCRCSLSVVWCFGVDCLLIVVRLCGLVFGGCCLLRNSHCLLFDVC